jgi:hypothetical protein
MCDKVWMPKKAAKKKTPPIFSMNEEKGDWIRVFCSDPVVMVRKSDFLRLTQLLFPANFKKL